MIKTDFHHYEQTVPILKINIIKRSLWLQNSTSTLCWIISLVSLNEVWVESFGTKYAVLIETAVEASCVGMPGIAEARRKNRQQSWRRPRSASRRCINVIRREDWRHSFISTLYTTNGLNLTGRWRFAWCRWVQALLKFLASFPDPEYTKWKLQLNYFQ